MLELIFYGIILLSLFILIKAHRSNSYGLTILSVIIFFSSFIVVLIWAINYAIMEEGQTMTTVMSDAILAIIFGTTFCLLLILPIKFVESHLRKQGEENENRGNLTNGGG